METDERMNDLLGSLFSEQANEVDETYNSMFGETNSIRSSGKKKLKLRFGRSSSKKNPQDSFKTRSPSFTSISTYSNNAQVGQRSDTSISQLSAGVSKLNTNSSGNDSLRSGIIGGTFEDDTLFDTFFQDSSHSKIAPSIASKAKSTKKHDKTRDETILDTRIFANATLPIHQGIDENGIESEEMRIAREILLGQVNDVPANRILPWLAQEEPYNERICQNFFQLMNFHDCGILKSLRAVCSRLCIAGESQQIDRILAAFARRWCECNKAHILASAGVVHAIAYSLILLNTDMHVANLPPALRMTRTQFLNNTLNAIKHQAFDESTKLTESGLLEAFEKFFGKDWLDNLIHTLKSMYASIQNAQIQQPKNFLNETISAFSSSNNPSPQEISSNTQPKIFLDSLLESSISSPQSESSSQYTRETRDVGDSEHVFKKGSDAGSSMLKRQESFNGFSPIDTATVDSFYSQSSNIKLNNESFSPNLSKYLYFKMVLDRGKQLRNQKWSRVFVSIQYGRFVINHLRTQFFLRMDKSKKHIEATEFYLAHCLANRMPLSKPNSYSFALTVPDKSILLFKLDSAESLNYWIYACNFWAAQISRASTLGSVSNAEFGWGPCCDAEIVMRGEMKVYPGDEVVIQDWQQPEPNLQPSMTSHDDHLHQLKEYLLELNDELEKHNKRRALMEEKFGPRSANRQKAMHNWESKSRYLLSEIVQFQTYVDTLLDSRKPN